MADVLVNALTQITEPTSVDSFVMVDRTTNEGQILDATLFAQGVLEVDCGTISSLPQTYQKTAIKSDMVLVHSEVETPAAMGSKWQVDTSNGSVTVSGTVNSGTQTKLKIYLARRRVAT